MLFHFTMNNPIWPDGQPWFTLLISAVAVGVVVANRKTMLTKGAGETCVLAPTVTTLGETAASRELKVGLSS